MDVLKKIKDLMKEHNLSSYALAKKSSLSQSTISNLFQRNTVPNVATIEKICNGLGITLSQFFSIDDEMVCLSELDKDLLMHWSKLSEQQKQGFLTAIKSI